LWRDLLFRFILNNSYLFLLNHLFPVRKNEPFKFDEYYRAASISDVAISRSDDKHGPVIMTRRHGAGSGPPAFGHLSQESGHSEDWNVRQMSTKPRRSGVSTGTSATGKYRHSPAVGHFLRDSAQTG
jgi:hypothetical protein